MKNVTLISLFNLLLTIQFLHAQTPDTLWTKIFGGSGNETGYDVQQTSDGGYIIVGETTSYGAGYYDVWIIKTDHFGDTLWTRTYGGAQDDQGYSIQQTMDGGYILAGTTFSFGAGGPDIWLLKMDEFGDTLWTKTFGGDNSEWGHGVLQTADGGYIITGDNYTAAAGYSKVWLIKTDVLGDTQWTRIYGENIGEHGNFVQQTSDDGFIIVGDTMSTLGYTDVWLIKTDLAGNPLWKKNFGGSSNEVGYSVQQTTDGGYILTGFTVSYGAGMSDLYLIKTNSLGDTLWTKTYGGGQNDYGYSVQQTLDGGYIVTGFTSSYGAGNSDVWIIKTNASGDTLWTKTLGGSSIDRSRSVKQLTNGEYIITGNTDPFSTLGVDLWLIKLGSGASGFYQDGNQVVSKDYILSQNHPNPFNPSTTIVFNLPKSSEVSLKVFNILGEEVAALVSDRLSAGSYSYEWDASNIASGVYLYRLQASDFIETRKMVLMK